MKHLFIALAAALLISCESPKGPNTKVDEKRSFKDIPLDATFDQVKDKAEFTLQLNDQCKALKMYTLTDSTHTRIGNITFGEVEAEFVLDSLNQVTLKNPSSPDVLLESSLKEAFSKEFGEPTKRTSGEYTYTEWQGKRYFIWIRERPGSDLTVIYGSSKGLVRAFIEEQRCEERKAKKMQSDL